MTNPTNSQQFEELLDSTIDDYLASFPSVSREQVLDFLELTQIDVESE